MKKSVLLFACLGFALGLFAQTTRTFFGKQGDVIRNERRAAFYRDVEVRPDSLLSVKYYNNDGTLLWYSIMKSVDPDVPVSKTSYYADGNLHRQEDYSSGAKVVEYFPSGQIKYQYTLDTEGRFHGDIVAYYENGTPSRRDSFDHGSLVKGVCYTEAGQVDEYVPFFTDASYNGKEPGNGAFLREWVYRNLQYPRAALNNMTQGVVIVGFTLKSNGVVSDVRVLRGADRLLDEAAVLVVRNSPAWRKPATRNGEPVEVYYSVPIAFVIE